MIKKKLKINVFDIVTSEIVSITNSEKRKLQNTEIKLYNLCKA